MVLKTKTTTYTSMYKDQSGHTFEVTRDKQIVWRYTGPHRVHELQILTTNGKPIDGEPLK